MHPHRATGPERMPACPRGTRNEIEDTTIQGKSSLRPESPAPGAAREADNRAVTIGGFQVGNGRKPPGRRPGSRFGPPLSASQCRAASRHPHNP